MPSRLRITTPATTRFWSISWKIFVRNRHWGLFDNEWPPRGALTTLELSLKTGSIFETFEKHSPISSLGIGTRIFLLLSFSFEQQKARSKQVQIKVGNRNRSNALPGSGAKNEYRE
ncbi:hypothetical protein Tco_0190303 [Tanacetum coccineum]